MTLELLKIRGLGSFYDLGSLSFGVPSEEIAVHGVEEVAFGLKLSGIGASVTFHVEAKIGDDGWYLIPDGEYTYTADGNYLIPYNHCSAIQQIRLLWVGSDGGNPSASAVIMPGKNS